MRHLERGQALFGAHAGAADRAAEPCLVLGQPRAILGVVPEMQDTGGEAAVLAAHAGMKEPERRTDILRW